MDSVESTSNIIGASTLLGRLNNQLLPGHDNARDTSKATCKGRGNVRDEREAASRGMQQREGGDNAREAIVVALSLLTWRALIVILLLIHAFFLVLMM